MTGFWVGFLAFLAVTAIPGALIGLGIAVLQSRLEDRYEERHR